MLEICTLFLQPDYSLIAKTCNLWRNYNDISDSWDSVLGIINHYGDHQEEFQPFAGPGHWNDPDMLIIGDFGLSLDQQQAQMALWAIFAAPLFMSNNLKMLSDESKAILLNKEVIAVNQDALGIQGRLVDSSEELGKDGVVTGNSRVYSRPLKNGDVAVALLNTYSFSHPRNITFKIIDVGLNSTRDVSVQDLFAMKNLGIFSATVSATVDPSGVRLFRLTPQH